MHDIKRIREEPEAFRAAMESRGVAGRLDGILALDEERRARATEADALKNERNLASRRIGQARGAGEDTGALQAEVRALGERIAALDGQAARAGALRDEQLLSLPNRPDPSVPVGAGASENRVVRTWGELPSFDFEPRAHVEIGSGLGLFDLERAARMSGSGFPLFLGAGARLERALIQFMLDLHTREHGYLEVSPPFLCHSASLRGTGQLPKLAEDMYYLAEDDLYLIPTAEVPLTNFYREEIIRDPLPIRLTGYSPCFRREAGAAGRETRGLIRVHQFDKVEMVKFVAPETSAGELESLVEDAQEVLERLGLAYRVVLLCTGDMSFAAAKCYDLEIWAPGQKAWLEVSSCSLFGDFQARRAGIRFKDASGRTAHPHTLNGSGVALPRLVVALLETFQQPDGSVALPAALVPYMGGIERLERPAPG